MLWCFFSTRKSKEVKEQIELFLRHLYLGVTVALELDQLIAVQLSACSADKLILHHQPEQ